MPHQAAAVKERIGYVPETPTLFESLTGEEFMELCGRLHGLDEPVLQTRLTTILEAFQLGADRLGRIESYSKGMRQKVLIGAALLHNPELLLLDEPLSGLDVHSALMVKDLLAALAAEGKTVLYSSHVLDVVERVCDRAIIIHRGRIIAEGSVADLKKSAGRESLEEVFRTLTETGTLETGVRSIVDALRG
jgi:ABC-2 type transport system ATP-binding protein